MDTGVADVICEKRLSSQQEALDPSRYPRTYGSSNEFKKSYFLVFVAEFLFVVFIHGDINAIILGFLVLANLAAIAYFFGSKISLYADKIESQSLFIFKRVIRRNEMLGWKLQVTSLRGSKIFSLVLKSRSKDLEFDINFKLDAAFYAWFPDLETQIQQNWQQWPQLKDL